MSITKMRQFYICITIFIITFCYHTYGHGDHGHVHEDEESLIRAGKEKWFKPPDEEEPQHQHGHDHHHGHDHIHSHDHHGHHHHGHDHLHGHDHHHHGHDHHHHGHDHHHHDHSHTATSTQKAKTVKKPTKKPRTFAQTMDMWWQAIFATLLISAAPFFILFFVPLESNAEKYQPLLKVLLSFASGGLLGDAFLHLIPHAIHPHSHGEEGHDHHHHDHSHGHDHGHDHSATTNVGLWVLAGIVAFLAVEKFVRYAKGDEHHHHHHGKKTDEKNDDDETKEKDETKKDSNSQSGDKKGEKKSPEVRKRKEKEEKPVDNKAEDKSDKKTNEDEGGPSMETQERMKVAGYLNLAADFTHNFTDGLAIGASFLGGQTLGIITTFTILLHEVPHEIGDFAILVQSGCSKRRAMFLQLSTATGAMAGCILGLLAENIGEAGITWILPFTAGGFIYIATVAVIPELLEDSNPKQSIKEIIAMFVGIGMMVLISALE